MLRAFLKAESGAITADWVLVTASVVGLGTATIVTVGGGIGELGSRIRAALAVTPIGYADVGQQAGRAMRTLVSMSFDDGDFTGWSSTRTGSSPDLGTFLGPFAGSDAPLRHNVTLPPGTTEAEISFDLLALNSWDGDNPQWSSGRGDGMSIVIDGHEVAFELFQHGVAGSESPMGAPRSSMVEIGGATYRTTMELRDQGAFFGDTWSDQVWAVQIAVDNPPAGGFALDLSSTTDQSVSDEAYGIGTFAIRAR